MARAEATAAVRRRLVDAAVGQLAEHGMRGLTHRRVEHRAGLAQGSAKYHFGNLQGLVAAVMEHMVEVELAHVMTVPAEVLTAAEETGRIPESVWQQARAVCAAMIAQPALVRARFELYLHAVGRPELQDLIRRGRDEFIARTARALTADGAAPADSPVAIAGARLVLALVDGMVLHELSTPDPDGREEAIDRMAVHLVTAAQAVRAPAGPLPRAD